MDELFRRCPPYFCGRVEELPDSQFLNDIIYRLLACYISKIRSPHETVSEGKALKSVFDYNRNRKQPSPFFIIEERVMAETVG